MHYIYIIQKIDDHRVYVGQSVNPRKRWSDHIGMSRKYWIDHNHKQICYIHRALAKYGVDKFDFYILQKCKTKEESNEMERFWVNILKSRVHGFGFNIKPGGKSLYNVDGPCQFLTPDQEKEIIRKYTEEKISATQIAKDYDFGVKPIYKCLYQNNVDIRDVGFYKSGVMPVNKLFDLEQEKEICNRYTNEQISISKLGEIYNCAEQTIFGVLKRNNIETLGNKVLSKGKRRSKATEFKKGQIPHNKRFTDEQEQEICRIYVENKLVCPKIAKIYNCNRGTIQEILNRHNVPIRSKNIFTEEQEKEICKKYTKDKLSCIKIAKIYNCNKTTILRLINRHGISTKPKYKR